MEIVDKRTHKFVIVPRTLVEDLALTHRDKAVYMALCLYTDNSTKQAFPSTLTIANKSGTSRSGVFRALRALENGGYIRRENRSNGIGSKLTNIYYLLDK